MGRGNNNNRRQSTGVLSRRGTSVRQTTAPSSHAAAIVAFLTGKPDGATIEEIVVALNASGHGPVLRHSIRSALYQNMDNAGKQLFERVGRGRYSLKSNAVVAPASGFDAAHKALVTRLMSYERIVMPLWQELASAATGRSPDEGDRARARAVRHLADPKAVPTQIKLVAIAQACRDIVEELALSVPCPVCHSEVGEPCATPRTKDKVGDKKEYRKVSHSERLELARERCRSRAQLVAVERARSIGNRAREVFIYTHTGYVMQHVRKYINHFESEGEESARALLVQEARLGLHEAVDRYNLDRAVAPVDIAVEHTIGRVQAKKKALGQTKANPLTFAAGRIRHRISEALEQGPLITAKSRAFDDRQRIQAALKSIENHGEIPSIENVAETTGVPVERVQNLMRSLQSKSRLDAPVRTEEQGSDLSTIIADDGPSMEEIAIRGNEHSVTREAIKHLSPFSRRIIELGFELTGVREDVEQKDLYDGVYLDPKTGQRFSAEGTVIADRKKRGESITKVTQRDLNRRFHNGELLFQAGNEESFRLALLKKQSQSGEAPREPSLKEKRDFIITRETGVPMTSGQIQDGKDTALYELSLDPRLKELRPRYRGNHELERSLTARQIVRRALIVMERLTPAEAEMAKAGRASRAGGHVRGPLVRMAEDEGWVNHDTGRVNWRKLRADVARHRAQNGNRGEKEDFDSEHEDLEALMSTV